MHTFQQWRSFYMLIPLLFGMLLFSGCASDTQQLPQSHVPSPSIIQANQWEHIPLPPAGQMLSYVVSPVDPATMYACTFTTHIDNYGGDSEHPITLWSTHDTGKHWTASLTSLSGTYCLLSLAHFAPQRIVLEVNNNSQQQRPCDNDMLYLSSNSGKSWQHIHHTSIAPVGATTTECGITVTAHHFYYWYSYGGGNNSPQLTMLERSDNDGISWSRSDVGLPARSMFFPPQELDNDETLTTSVRDGMQVSDKTSTLWISPDAGRTWKQQGSIPAGIFLLASYKQKQFYALTGEQVPSYLYILHVVQSHDGQNWQSLPPLPVPGASSDRPGLLQALTPLDNGTLLAFGPNPNTGVPAHTNNGKQSEFWLWIWKPQTSQWQVLSVPLRYTTQACALCWHNQLATGTDNSTYLYVYHHNNDSILFRLRLPDQVKQ